MLLLIYAVYVLHSIEELNNFFIPEDSTKINIKN